MQMDISKKLNEKSIKLKAMIRIKLNAQCATTGQPVGPLLGQYGIPVMPFCKEFNKRTSMFHSDVVVFVVMKLFLDNSYTFVIKSPSTSFLLIRASILWKKEFLEQKELSPMFDLEYEPLPSLTAFQLYEVVVYKQKNLFSSSLKLNNKELCLKSVGTLKSISSIYIMNTNVLD